MTMEADAQWQDFACNALAVAHGLRSGWSTPILSSEGRVLGSFAMLQGSPAHAPPDQQALISSVARIAGLAMEHASVLTALKHSEACLAETQRLSSTGSFSWRVTTDDIVGSKQLYRIFELDEGKPITLALIQARIHPDDRPALQQMLERMRHGGCDIEHELRLLMPDQRVKYAQLTAHASEDPSGEIDYIGAVQDVTRRHRSEAALGKAQSNLARMSRAASLGPLSASIAHEVSQPISGIVINTNTCLRMLTADPPDIDGARDSVRRTLRDANRTSEIIAQLRALFSTRETKLASVDLNEAAREVIALAMDELQQNRVTLRTELQECLPPAMGDRVQLQQVILNLLLNASEAMNDVEDRPRLLLVRSARDDGDRLRFTVRDSGAGLDPNVLERLFEPFHTTKQAGMGIGLFISRFIIESHQGWLRAMPSDGPGATFAFSIPSVAGRRCLGGTKPVIGRCVDRASPPGET